MNQKLTPDDIERGLEAINIPLKDGNSMNDWAHEENNQLLIKELLLYREAILREQGDSLDKDRIYLEFIKQRRLAARRKQIRKIPYYVVAAVAIIVLIVITGNFLQKETNLENDDIITEYIAQNTPQEITLQIDSQEVSPIKHNVKSSTPQTTGYQKKNKRIVHKAIPVAVPNVRLYTYALSIPRGKSYHLVLEDSTEVWLNADSKLLYPSHFDDGERVVELSGEAYFKVAKDKSRPFIVKTQYLTTRVLGTEFNLRAYKNNVEVTLIEGSVAVQQNGGKEIILIPGQNLTVVKENLEVSNVDIRKYTSWVEGYFYFDAARLGDIMKELGRWYNINIEFEDKQLKEYEFKFWAKRDDNIEKTINNLNQIGKVWVDIEENKIVIKKKR